MRNNLLTSDRMNFRFGDTLLYCTVLSAVTISGNIVLTDCHAQLNVNSSRTQKSRSQARHSISSAYCSCQVYSDLRNIPTDRRF